VDGVVPRWVVRPGTAAEVAACVGVAAAERLALVASGLGAHLDVGAVPRRLDVLLRLDRLGCVLAHEAADMTVTAEAGCPLPALAAALARAGQWLPLDPPRGAATTVGGLVAANLSGPLRTSQGTVRDLLLGLRFVGADGALVSGGGRVVKNVAGYDLPKLHVGALGTVGVLVEATFKVRPRPACETAVMAACAAPSQAAALALAVRDALSPLWLECAGPGVLGEHACVAVGLGGGADAVDAACDVVERAARATALVPERVADGAALRARLGAVAGEAIVVRAATLPTGVGDVLDRLARAGARVVAQVASGTVRAALDDPARVAELVRALRPLLEAGGGGVVVERAPAALKQAIDPWGDPGPARGLMAGLKGAFDPDGIFAPGRFVGGL
jgi:glycolate oxidase FAD binding subunit